MSVNIKGPVLVRFNGAETAYGSDRYLDTYVDVTRVLALMERDNGTRMILDGGVTIFLSDPADKVLARLTKIAEEME